MEAEDERYSFCGVWCLATTSIDTNVLWIIHVHSVCKFSPSADFVSFFCTHLSCADLDSVSENTQCAIASSISYMFCFNNAAVDALYWRMVIAASHIT